MNPSGRFYKGEVSGAEKVDFDDSGWGRVSLPHSVDTLPSEASGCANYQGVSWYRKHFSVKPGLLGKKLFVYFEAVMGKPGFGSMENCVPLIMEAICPLFSMLPISWARRM